ncbi:MAG: glycosyltransferase family 39 protein [Sedimentisphaerales bacterium]|nr:glycosyltransferase family 39 protein [Sedimentisphaerales bacterium]
MLIKDISKQSLIKLDIINVTFLFLIAMIIGLFLITTTVVISKDSTIFIEYAQKFGTSPKQTMIQEYQHPGYPVLILATSKIIGMFYKTNQLFLFIYSAQGAALLCRILTIIVLYFLGKKFVGPRLSLWGVLILILLPKPAEYGSDALSDWPNMFFIAMGMLLLFYGAKYGKWWFFTLAGLAAGLAYLVRPEGAQIIIYGTSWLILQLFWKKRTLNISRAVIGLVSMIFIFLIIVTPYMKLKGAILPKKSLDIFSSIQNSESKDTSYLNNYNAELIPSDIAEAFLKIFENIGDTLMWVFLVPYLVGLYLFFKKKKFLEPEQFFIISLIIINVPLMIWLHCSHGYMSGRHTLTLVVFTIFFIPTGLQALATLLNTKYSRGYQHTHRWFAILMTIGIAICIPKLFSPLHSDKLVFREAAKWLEENTEHSAIVGVPDYRISFYAERIGIKIIDENVPQEIQYLVEIIKKKESEQVQNSREEFELVFNSESKKEKKEILIFKKVTQ